MKKNSTVKLELYNLNELPSSWKKDWDEETLREKLEELNNSNRRILKQYTPSDMADQIRDKMGKEGKSGNTTADEIPFKKPDRTSWGKLLIPAAAAILFALLLPAMIFRDKPGGISDITRVKGLGQPELKIYRYSGDGTEILNENSTAEEFDLIQLGYRVSSQAYGMIISIDGRGVVTRHLPENEEEAVLLETGGEHLLPFSYELDDAPEYETFYLVTSDIPFPLNPVIDAVASAARENGMVLNIPKVIQKNGLQRQETGEVQQYAVPIRKED